MLETLLLNRSEKLTYCTICGKLATVGVYCDACAQMLEKRVNKGYIVTKAAIVSHQDRRQSSVNKKQNRPAIRQAKQERPSGMKMAFGKDGLPIYCPECGNLLYTDGMSFTCKACSYTKKD
jgi:hypothetical protein